MSIWADPHAGGWLTGDGGGGLVEPDEIAGYHLEQTYPLPG
jgi:hypothetical protein